MTTISSQIERLRKASEWSESPNFSYDSDRGQCVENKRLTPILRAYEQVIKIQAEALELYADVGLPENDFIEKCLEQAMAERAADNVTINLGGLHISKKAREAIASVEKILVEVK